MTSIVEIVTKDINDLVSRGGNLVISMQLTCYPDKVKSDLRSQLGKSKVAEFIGNLPDFDSAYELWYSEAKSLVKRMLPDRLQDFVRHYESDQKRKAITASTYRVSDFIAGIQVTDGIGRVIVGPTSAITHLKQQVAIVNACAARFKSSLFDIQSLVQGDIFDSELDAAAELAKHKFLRAAGALAGVVLEKHLAYVCSQHGIKIAKTNPGISTLNDALKDSKIIDIPQWRGNQLLGDIRNLCDHAKAADPTPEQIDDLITGTKKVLKTIF